MKRKCLWRVLRTVRRCGYFFKRCVARLKKPKGYINPYFGRILDERQYGSDREEDRRDKLLKELGFGC